MGECLTTAPISQSGIHVPAPVLHPGKEQVTAEVVGSLHPHRKPELGSWHPALAWPDSGRCGHLGNKPRDGSILLTDSHTQKIVKIYLFIIYLCI